jgi:hypothetical protein
MNIKLFFKKIRDDRAPRQEFHDATKAALMAYMEKNPPAPKIVLMANRVPRGAWKNALAVSLAVIFIACTTAIGTVSAAQTALPGDALYGIKLAADQLSVAISNSPTVRVAVAARRLQEVKQALASPAPQSAQAQTDIKNALQQYQTDTRGALADIGSKNISTTTAQSVIQQTAAGQDSIAQILSSKNATGTIVHDLERSLRSSARDIRSDMTSSASTSATSAATATLQYHGRRSKDDDPEFLTPSSSPSIAHNATTTATAESTAIHFSDAKGKWSDDEQQRASLPSNSTTSTIAVITASTHPITVTIITTTTIAHPPDDDKESTNTNGDDNKNITTHNED